MRGPRGNKIREESKSTDICGASYNISFETGSWDVVDHSQSCSSRYI